METKRLREMGNVERVRLELKACERGADDFVRVRCVDRSDMEEIRTQLTQDELNRVRFDVIK